MARLAAARASDAKRARRARLALLWGGNPGPVVVYFWAGAAVSAAVALLLGSLNLLVNAMVSLVGISDWSLWSLVGNLGRALGDHVRRRRHLHRHRHARNRVRGPDRVATAAGARWESYK